jgi:hypothetical protein
MMKAKTNSHPDMRAKTKGRKKLNIEYLSVH